MRSRNLFFLFGGRCRCSFVSSHFIVRNLFLDSEKKFFAVKFASTKRRNAWDWELGCGLMGFSRVFSKASEFDSIRGGFLITKQLESNVQSNIV